MLTKKYASAKTKKIKFENKMLILFYREKFVYTPLILTNIFTNKLFCPY